MTVFGYVRVSTDNQLENYSIDEQAESIRAYCKAKGWTLLKVYTDGGYSGGNINRPALQQMLEDIRGQTVGAVVVYKLDRLSRSQKDTLTLIEDHLLSNHTDFVSINENFDTSTPLGRAMIGILSVFAQLEKDQITERFTMGRIGRSKAGYFHGGGNAPYGYQYENGQLIVNPHEAEIVQKIFQSFLAGRSINAIWNSLDGRHSGKWSATKIGNILRNSVYIGKVKFSGEEYDGVHQPIVSQETFTAANQLLNSSERHGETTACKTPFRAQTLLSGLIFCGRCGARYCGAHGAYKCYSRSKTTPRCIMDPNCKNDNWKIPKLNGLVVEEVRKIAKNSKAALQIIEKSKSPGPTIDLRTVKARIKEIESQIRKLVDLYQVGGIPMDVITQKIEGLSQEKESLNAKLIDTQKEKQDSRRAFLSALNDFNVKFDSSDLETQRLIISCLIERVIINGIHVEIKWRI